MVFKKIILFFLLLAPGFLYSQNFNWITPGKTYIKLYITEDGMYRIDRNDFLNTGVNPSTIDPRTVKLFFKGNQVPLFFQGEDDGVFNDNDFFDFYGIRNSGGLTPYRNGFTNTIAYTVDEYYNLYSDTSAYFIDWGGANGNRYSVFTNSSSLSFPQNFTSKSIHREVDFKYYLGETTNPNSDYRYFNTELAVGEGWFWKEMKSQSDSVIVDNFLVENLNPNGNASIRVNAYPNSILPNFPNEHKIQLRINSIIVDTVEANDYTRIDTTISFPANILVNGNNNIYIRYLSPSNATEVYLNYNYYRITYNTAFSFINNKFSFNLTGSDSTLRQFKISSASVSNPVYIYDVNNFRKIQNNSFSSDTLIFSGNSNSKFEIYNTNNLKKPAKIRQRIVPNLVSNSTGADYVIVYNKFFESSVNQLTSHRESFNNFRVFKAEIEDIYDVFNFGIENPLAVRLFLKNAFDTWTAPKLSYVNLFGRASLDPKKNDPANIYFQNFVPTYGNPPSDGYFANFNIGSFTYFHQVSIGRLPAYTPVEAQDMVNKIIQYETQPPASWWKSFLFISGGKNRNEQLSFQNQSNAFINSYVTANPIKGNPDRVYRNDSSGFVTFNYKDSIKKSFDKGALILNFIGHAASQDWEIGLEDPATINNGNKLPLVFSMTCFTGRMEPNVRSFGEKFIYLPNKLAIGFVGSTGWSFAGQGNQLNDYMLRSFARDSIRHLGKILSNASRIMSGDSNNFASRNTINSYTLYGDPAVKLLMPSYPEFDITPADYSLSNNYPTLNEEIILSVSPKNFGTNADSLKIRFNLQKNGFNYKVKDTVVRNLGYSGSYTNRFILDSLGNYNMRVILDPDDWYPRESFVNNIIDINIPVKNISFVPLKPANNQAINNTTLTFTGLNPNVNSVTNNIKVIFQIDTNINFSSPARQTFFRNNASGSETKFQVNLHSAVNNKIYFWRMNAVINNDSSGWSETRKIIYTQDFNINPLDTNVLIYKKELSQFEPSEINNLEYIDGGFKLGNYNGKFFVRSKGNEGENASYFIVNDQQIFIDGGEIGGARLLKVRKLDGRILEYKKVIMNTDNSSDSVLAFLNTFDSTSYLLALSCAIVWDPSTFQPLGRPFNAATKQKFRQFGSIYADSLEHLGWFDTWAFIGSLNADTSQTSEAYNYWNFGEWLESTAEYNPVFIPVRGSITTNLIPAASWNYLAWSQILIPGSPVTFDLYGVGQNNLPSLIQQGITTNNFYNLNGVNPINFPGIRLISNVSIDTLSGLQSSTLTGINVSYVPPAELIPDNNSFVLSDSSVQQGDTVSVSVKYSNVGFSNAYGIINRWYAQYRGGVYNLRIDTLNSIIKPDSIYSSDITINTSPFGDSILVFFETKLKPSQNELFTYNNIAFTTLYITGDSLKPKLDVTYNGQMVQNGDFITSNPEIVADFFDDSRLVITDVDTSVLRVKLNGVFVPYFINSVPNPELQFIIPDDFRLLAKVIYKPVLPNGNYRFEYIARDKSDNIADTVRHNLVVNDDLKILELTNYPNPMVDRTSFMFNLQGGINPRKCTIKIYTVAGRLVKDVIADAKIGYNQVDWDGRDNDGDNMANGVYLYKMILEGDSKTETSIQKLVILK
ncbi:MAG TPA: hypothetical protein DEP28_04910 [Bacteroidetes bacterium]|nr:hypothetical protein [Bacteroidota bacterium]